jgi:hypothetical protein
VGEFRPYASRAARRMHLGAGEAVRGEAVCSQEASRSC